MNNDKYGRSITLDSSSGKDVYSATNPVGAKPGQDGSVAFTLGFDSGTEESQAYSAIEGMAPPWYVFPVIKKKP